MIELEVKVLNIDIIKVIDRLEDLGATLIDREVQENIIIDNENLDIEASGAYLRIRSKKSNLTLEEANYLTLKKQERKENIRKSEEVTSEISNVDETLKILSHLGFKPIKKGTKERISYLYDDIRFDIDTWDKNTYPRPYLEIEVIREEDIAKAVELLGLDPKNVTTKSIVELQKDLS